MKRISYLILFIILCSLYSFSQTYRPFDQEFQLILDTTRFQFGPFRIFPRIELTELGYDSDVYRSSELHDPVPDFTFTLSPQISATVLFQNNLILTFAYIPEYVFYQDESQLRGWSNSYSADFKWRLISNLVVSGNYLYITRRRRPSPEINERVDEHREGYGGSIFLEARSNLNFGIGASTQKITYGEYESLIPGDIPWITRSLTRDENAFNAELNYVMFSERQFFLNWGYTEYSFKYPEAQFRDSISSQVSSGISFPVIGQIRGIISVGYKMLTPKAEDRKGYSGFIGDVTLDYRFSIFGIRLGYRRDTPFSQFRGSIYYIDNQLRTGASLYFTRNLRLDYRFNYGKSSYPESISVDLPAGGTEELLREDTYDVHIIGFAYRILENTGVGLQYSHWNRESNYYFATRSSSFIGGYVVYDF